MTQEQILREFDALPRQEQESVALTIYARLHSVEVEKEKPADAPHRERRAALARLQGALKGPGIPPSDNEVNRMRDEYLIRKYQ